MKCLSQKSLKIKNLFEQEPALIFEIRQGIERECLRVDSHGVAAKSKHHQDLGSKLTHANITTDYAENLLEFITGVHSSTKDLLKELSDLHTYTLKKITPEVLWMSSMPCVLATDSDIPLAYYGESNVGKLKTLYRRGLGERYGRSMQSIAGLHYNFSFSDSFWEKCRLELKSELSLKDFKNDQYFSLIRNFRRNSWILVYLFGATPVVDKSFLKNKNHELKQISEDTYGSEFGTSLRMGGLGYTSDAQQSISICYNRLDTYVKTLEEARLTTHKKYEEIGLERDGEKLQLNTNLLQIDNEFYSQIRPKNVAKTRESALGALHNRGIEYIEVRLLDLNPDEALGVDEEQIQFLHLFLTWCLVSDSPLIDKSECAELEENFERIVKQGRDPQLKLVKAGKDIPKKELIQSLLQEMKDLAVQLSVVEPEYIKALETQMAKVQDESKLPSNIVFKNSQKSFLNWNIEKSSHLSKILKEQTIDDKHFEQMAAESHIAQEKVEQADKLSFDNFLTTYFEDIKINYGSLS